MEYFQATNVLPLEDYQTLMTVKDPLFTEKKGCIIIDEQGVTVTDRNNNARLDQGTILNYKMDIEGFKIKYPDSMIKLLTIMQNIFTERGIKNARPYVGKTYRNNGLKPWHKHSLLKGAKYRNWYCAIYYMHPNWDISFGGQLRVSKIADTPGEKFHCYSNSFVAHNGIYGHAVDELKQGYEGNRDIFLTHWITE